MSYPRIKHPSDVGGRAIRCGSVVISRTPRQKRLADFSQGQFLCGPYSVGDAAAEKYPVETITMDGNAYRRFGASASIEPGMEGLVSHSELARGHSCEIGGSVVKQGPR